MRCPDGFFVQYEDAPDDGELVPERLYIVGEGPGFLLCRTYRFHGHHVGDIDRSYYRSREEEERWKNERDPLEILSAWLIDQKLTDEDVLEQINNSVQTEVEAALEFAKNAPYPDAEEVDRHVYA